MTDNKDAVDFLADAKKRYAKVSGETVPAIVFTQEATADAFFDAAFEAVKLRAENERLISEATENALIIGKSGSRELDLITENERLKNKLTMAKEQPAPVKTLDLPFEVAGTDAGVMTWNEAMKKYDGTKYNSDGWRLPTKDELDLIYKNKDKIHGLNLTGSLPAGWYWSSTPVNDSLAYDQRFSDGSQFNYFRGFGSSVRCVR